MACRIQPACIVVVLLISPLDEVLAIVVLVRSTIVKDLIQEGVHELNEVSAIYERDQPLIELADHVRADEHSLNIVLHLL